MRAKRLLAFLAIAFVTFAAATSLAADDARPVDQSAPQPNAAPQPRRRRVGNRPTWNQIKRPGASTGRRSMPTFRSAILSSRALPRRRQALRVRLGAARV
jgi:hypothetical protein